MEEKSTWRLTAAKAPEYPQLTEDIHSDVVIIGAGITGLTLAYLLKAAGKEVVVVEGEKIGDGTTAHSSNHLTTSIDFGYANVAKKFSEETMKLVAQSRVDAIDQIEEIVERESIACDFKRVDGYLYAEETEHVESVAEEFRYSKHAGLPVEEVLEFDLPIRAHRIIKYPRQAVFNSQKYLLGIATKLQEGGSCRIFCQSKVSDIDHAQNRIKTEKGSVTADSIVMATHTPIQINMLQTMVVPYRSYMISARLSNDRYPSGLYWDDQEPYHYTRSYEQNGRKWLIVGGADNQTGHEEHEDHYAKLERYVREKFAVDQIESRWSAQYYEPADGLPYIGKSPFANTYLATGFSGDGLVYGTVAAMLLKGLILEDRHNWLQVYDSRRFTPSASAGKFVSHNLHVAKHLVKQLFNMDKLKALKPGEGQVVSHEGHKYAVSKDENHELTVVSAICSHMGCSVNWNSDEKTWDCPCHGSRFTGEGNLIEGPATSDLQKVDVDVSELADHK